MQNLQNVEADHAIHLFDGEVLNFVRKSLLEEVENVRNALLKF